MTSCRLEKAPTKSASFFREEVHQGLNLADYLYKMRGKLGHGVAKQSCRCGRAEI